MQSQQDQQQAIKNSLRTYRNERRERRLELIYESAKKQSNIDSVAEQNENEYTHIEYSEEKRAHGEVNSLDEEPKEVEDTSFEEKGRTTVHDSPKDLENDSLLTHS